MAKKEEVFRENGTRRSKMAKKEEVFRENGTLFGCHFGKPKGKRGPALTVNIDRQGQKLATAFTLDRNDFFEAYARAADRLAEYHGVGKKSKMYAEMVASGPAFIKAHGLKLKTVSYQQVS